MIYKFEESKIEAVIRADYDLSSSQGLGFMHARAGGLDEKTIAEIKRPTGIIAARMDYIYGRSVKLTIRRDGPLCYIPANYWHDHSVDDLRELAKRAELGEPVRVSEE